MLQHEAECRTPACRESQRQILARQVKEYLAKGGKITVLPTPAYKQPIAHPVVVIGDR